MAEKTNSRSASRVSNKSTPKAEPKTAAVDHKHAALEASITALKKEIEALKGQCHACCADLSELKNSQKSPEVQELSELLTAIIKFPQWDSVRKYVKRNMSK